MSHGTSILDGFIGPCVHGRDPYDRCDGCGELTPAQAEAVARAEAFPATPRTPSRGDRYALGYIDALNVAAAMVRDAGQEQLAGAIEDAPVGADTDPLTVERAREWLEKELRRVSAISAYEMTKPETDRWALLYSADRHALAALLVDAAAGRVR